MEWKTIITDPDEAKVFRALDGPNCTWRTVSGIARDSRLPEMRVWEIITKYNTRLTALAGVPSISGSPLVGLLENVA